MIENTTKPKYTVLIKLLNFFNSLKSKDPLLYSEYIKTIRYSETQEIIYVYFNNWYLTLQAPKYYSKSNRVIINIGNIIGIAFGGLRKWSTITSLTYDDRSTTTDAWQKAIEMCKILKRIGLINFKQEMGAVTEIYVRVNP